MCYNLTGKLKTDQSKHYLFFLLCRINVPIVKKVEVHKDYVVTALQSFVSRVTLLFLGKKFNRSLSSNVLCVKILIRYTMWIIRIEESVDIQIERNY